MSSPGVDGAPGRSACLFEVAGRTFAVEISQAREVRTFDGYTVVPLAPPHLLGMANLRGAIVPILDLQTLLGLPARPRAGAVQTLVVEANLVRVALAIDAVIGIESFDEILASRDVGVDARGLERGALRRGDDAIAVLEVVNIVDALTRRATNQEGRA